MSEALTFATAPTHQVDGITYVDAEAVVALSGDVAHRLAGALALLAD